MYIYKINFNFCNYFIIINKTSCLYAIVLFIFLGYLSPYKIIFHVLKNNLLRMFF